VRGYGQPQTFQLVSSAMLVRRYMIIILLLAATASCAQPQSYANSCTKPLAHWWTPKDGYGHLLPHNFVTIDRPRQIRWNDAPVTYREFTGLLMAVRNLEPQPETILIFAPDVDCIDVRNLRRLVDETLGCRDLRLCGEGAGDWEGNSRISRMPAPEFQEALGREVDKMVEDAAK
jgi:hypothetical protein